MSDAPLIPVSWGEAIDKLTILEIKSARLIGESALTNVRKELSTLADVSRPVLAAHPDVAAIAAELKTINGELWDIEDSIRAKETAGSFDGEFISLARSVYKKNDERAKLKKRINIALSSSLMEEKSYKS